MAAVGDTSAIRRDSTPPYAALAQLVEQRFCKPQVVGSSPTGGFSCSHTTPPARTRFTPQLIEIG